MNLIKISVFAILSFLVTFQATAQIQFGVKAGLNINNIGFISENEDDELDTKMLFRYHVGATANYDINEVLSLQPSLLFSVKGFRVNESAKDDFSESTLKGHGSFYYLEIPINLAYKINNFQIYAGPYAAFGIGGNGKSETTQKINFGGLVSEQTITDKITYKPYYREITQDDDFKDNENPYSGLDYGLNIGVGYKVNNLLFNVGYSYGLGNWLPKAEGNNDYRKDNKIQNRVITLSASYFFGE
ncbi:porin family protein [Bernardetia sp. MNP-M8]|uniref:porin family protein n=1 Tax=Bernardetia sp. MNP-M8 TaxID=3127470 RepID=UPI0030D403BF